jgi:Flp pilus assembly protein TadD
LAQTSAKIGSVAALITAICGVVVITHWPALAAKALSFDDQQYLTGNALVQNPSWNSAKRFLTEVLEPSTVEGYYQPLAMISLMLDYATGGRKNNLIPFHTTSLALHTANTALIIVLLYLLFGNIWAAAAAGLLFGVHPMTVEPIPWVGERKTLLGAFFAFWSLILYVRYARSGGWKSYLGCFLLYLLALMSKPTSTPLPAVMLLMDYWPLNRLGKKTIFEKIPLFVMGGIFACITYISQHRTAVTVLPTKYGPEYVPAVLCHNIIFYLYKIIWPVNLSSHYAFPKPFGLSSPVVLAGVIGTCILIPVLLLSLRFTKAALTGWLIFFVATFPTMGVIGFTTVIASDKFAYLPSIGLLMALAAFLIWLSRFRKAAVITIFVVMMLAASEAFASRRYLAYWKDSVTLTMHMLTLAPDSAQLNNNLGYALAADGNTKQAIEFYQRALQLEPNYPVAITNLGCVYADTGNLEKAVEMHRKAIALRPSLALAHYNLASVYGKLGRHDEAMAEYKKALELNPDIVEVHFGLGIAYANSKLYSQAEEEFKRTLKLNPEYAQAHFSLALLYFDTGRKELALQHLEALKKLNSNLAAQLAPLINK